MTDWTTLTDSELAQDEPVTQEKMRALRDNPVAITEGSSGAPKISNSAFNDLTIGAERLQTGTTETNWVFDRIPTAGLGSEKFQTGTDERDWVLSRIASLSAGAVGTYAMLTLTNTSVETEEFGETHSASELAPCSASGAITASPSLSGTWRCLGYATTSGTEGSGSTTLWVRIA